MNRLTAIIVAVLLGCLAAVALGATPNFVMRGNFPPEFIAKAEQQAEHCRKTLAIEWLGYELPAWSKPCTVELVPTTNTGGGSTFYGFDGSKAFDFEGKWTGPEERLLQDVIPHEVLHTVLATKFGQVPRWADEGAAMNSEFTDTANKLFDAHLHQKLYRPNDGGFPTDQLLRFTEYPKDFQTFYAQSYSLSRFLIQFNGKRGFVDFMEQALRINDYEPALKDHYGLTEDTLQTTWLSWYQAGQPLSPDQLGVRSVSYAAPCRWIWNGSGWVQACDQQQYQPQVRPAQPTNPAPLQTVPPKPQQPVKGCTCGDVKSCGCDPGLAAIVADISRDLKEIKQGMVQIKEQVNTIESRVSDLETREYPLPDIEAMVNEAVKNIKPCECKSEDDAAKRPGQPAIKFDIRPLTRGK